MTITKTQKDLARANGFTKIQDGVYLSTSEYLIEDQKDWDDEDDCKNFDFSESEFWITTDSGTEPEAV